ncbi:hypothetical protein J2810_003325 [Chryseobacterium rhizosphaerae]|nr:hypothetical protein [Chryseobacterium rhizosphaerae]
MSKNDMVLVLEKDLLENRRNAVFLSIQKKEVSKDLFFYFYSPLHFIENGKQAPQA